MTPRTLSCQVTAVEDLTPDVFRVRLEGRAEAMAHAPGQYLELKLDDETWVPFSIASAHAGDGTLELHIQHWPERENSARLRELIVVAHHLTVRLPGGDCVLDTTSRRPLLLVAAGTGFAQAKAIVEASLHEVPERPIELWWAARERRDLYLESLPRQWAESHENVRFHVVTEAAPEPPVTGERIQGHLGRIDQALATGLEDVSGYDVYLSGSPGMVYACVDVLASLGLEPSRVFSDVFAYAPRRPLVPTAGVLRRGSAG
ncbi:NAD(P)H-flavin reductase [Halomonas sp. MCCC 1A17488]|uniref:NAD(P)H-flavin reductase n=1 Tax=Billgrantia sulfidoxydans TaxID=2733484 RepID=A0ABX7W1W5_9GAMM|nr:MULTISPECIES: NAD(P)H-flavin reductase [Halomonas]MCE8016728.1 NAD(P)H-flavin reductase [Halomonas sp. MCCC 1A17488]MCG3240061.1 NAD(P)H-flavin reductase [Halomonas sp. MCCC 1A17488]QPP50056.1 NAD(P)H-flavin reductase [Halomonas sp. SS10-MC5]QTP53667.1 NAD(P)H-flavin reductase [Halomonas sulfidoxydans]